MCVVKISSVNGFIEKSANISGSIRGLFCIVFIFYLFLFFYFCILFFYCGFVFVFRENLRVAGEL